MSLPAIRAVRNRYPEASIAVLAKPWVGDLYAREKCIDYVIPYSARGGLREWGAKRQFAQQLRKERFNCAILLQNAFEAALIVWMAGIPRRIGYNRDGRGWLLTDAIPVPEPGDIPRHERFYYLELLRRVEICPILPPVSSIELDGREEARDAGNRRFNQAGLPKPVIGISPGAAYGTAKRWLPDRFAEAASRIAQAQSTGVAVFGSAGERELCQQVADQVERGGVATRNFAGQTTLGEFIEMAAACRLFLTNDSGAMHIASALGTPTVTVFGATDHTTTGPTGRFARMVREQVRCSPCLLRECPIDHRCMTRVTVDRVARLGLELWRESEGLGH